MKSMCTQVRKPGTQVKKPDLELWKPGTQVKKPDLDV